MLLRDGNENVIIINRYNLPKNLHVPHTFLYISLPFYCTTKTQNLFSYPFFMDELLDVLTKNFVACGPVCFYFFTAAHFHLPGRWHFSFSHCCHEIFMLFFQQNLSPFLSSLALSLLST